MSQTIRPGDALRHPLVEVLTAHPLWTDVRIGLAAGAHRKQVAIVRAALPPMPGKREARDGKRYSPRGTAGGKVPAVRVPTPRKPRAPRALRAAARYPAPVPHPCG